PGPTLFPYTTLFRSVGADHRVEVAGESGALHLERQTLHVGIGDQHHALARTARGGEKVRNMGMDRDQVLDLGLEQRDVQPEFARSEEHTSELQSREN